MSTRRSAMECEATELVGRLVTPEKARPFQDLHAMNRMQEEMSKPDPLGAILVLTVLCAGLWAGVCYAVWQIGRTLVGDR